MPRAPRHQQTEGNCLRAAVGELFVAGLREEQASPVMGQGGQRVGLAIQRFDHFVTQQPAKPGGHIGKFLDRPHHGSGQLATVPVAELVAVGVDEVGQGQQTQPLRLVVTRLDAAWVAALARCLEFYEADQRASHRYRTVGPCLEVFNRRLADGDNRNGFQSTKRRQLLHEILEGPAQLVFWLATGSGTGSGTGQTSLASEVTRHHCSVFYNFSL